MINLLFIFSIIVLSLVIIFIFYVSRNDKKYLLRFKDLDEELIKLVHINNFFNTDTNKISLKDINFVKDYLNKIKENSDHWNVLFEKKFSQIFNSYLFKDREIYYRYKSARNSLISFVVKDIETFIAKYESAIVKELDFSNDSFFKKFYLGLYKPNFEPLHFTEIKSNININDPLKTLDDDFLKLSSLDNFFSKKDEIFTTKNEDELEKNYKELKENYSTWKANYDSYLNNRELLSTENRNYLYVRNSISSSILKDLELFIKNKSSYSSKKYYIDTFYNQLISLPSGYTYKNLSECRENFYKFKKI